MRSAVATRYQLGFTRHAGSLTVPLRAATPQGQVEQLAPGVDVLRPDSAP